MNGFSIRGRARTAAIFQGTTILIELLMFPLWGHPVCKILLSVVLAVCILSVVYEMLVLRSMGKANNEAPDERDQTLMWKAANSALLYFQLAFGVLVVLALLVMIRSGGMTETIVIFTLLAITLPAFMKNCFYLYYEANDEGEYYE